MQQSRELIVVDTINVDVGGRVGLDTIVLVMFGWMQRAVGTYFGKRSGLIGNAALDPDRFRCSFIWTQTSFIAIVTARAPCVCAHVWLKYIG